MLYQGDHVRRINRLHPEVFHPGVVDRGKRLPLEAESTAVAAEPTLESTTVLSGLVGAVKGGLAEIMYPQEA